MQYLHTFQDWQERRAKNTEDQKKHNYSISYINRLEGIEYTDFNTKITLETCPHPNNEVSVIDLADKYDSYDNPEFLTALERIIEFLTIESKTLYLECRNEKQSNEIARRISSESLVDMTLWSVKIIDKNIVIFFSKISV